jgi:tight adherence protein C
VLAAKVVLAAVATGGGFLLFAGSRTPLTLTVWIGAAVLGAFTPDLLLYSRGQERRKAIGDALPDTLDQMSIAVEAGLGFDSAMARAGRTGEGPLAEELIRTLQEVQIGVPRIEAIRHLGDRTEQADLRHFVLAVIQADSYGIPVADVLRAQAAEQRLKRRQRAEEHAMKIPVKIIFPLVLCILPTLFVGSWDQRRSRSAAPCSGPAARSSAAERRGGAQPATTGTFAMAALTFSAGYA